MLPYDRPILLVVEQPSQVEEVVTHLLRVGFDDVQGYMEGGMDAWETAGLPLVTLSTLSVHDLKQQLDQQGEADGPRRAHGEGVERRSHRRGDPHPRRQASGALRRSPA